MKIGLYSITYLGCWYRGEALTLPELIRTAREFGYDGVEIDGKRPHGNPLDWPKNKCQELRRVADQEGIDALHQISRLLRIGRGNCRRGTRIRAGRSVG